MHDPTNPLIGQFQDLAISAPRFGHREHVEVAFHMLKSYEFVEACARYARTIKAMAEKHGAPEKYNATITFAFISVIAERLTSGDFGIDFQEFLESNPDLLEKQLLGRWYSDERLNSAQARAQFLLPDVPTPAA